MSTEPDRVTEKLRALVKEWTRRRDMMRTYDNATGKCTTYVDGLIDAHSDVLKDVAEHLPSLSHSTELCAGCGKPNPDCTCCGNCGHPDCSCDHFPL